MGVIKEKLPLLTQSKVAKRLTAEVESQFTEAGLNAAQISTIINKVVVMAKDNMDGKYTVMGGYSAEEQLFDKAKKLMFELDEQEKLEELLDEFDSSEDSVSVAEPDIEDAYNTADTINFTGSEKQINWARSIATKSSEEIARAWKKKNFSLPGSAKWWIDNRNDIYSALLKL